MKKSLEKAGPMAEAIALLLYPFGEVVLHDLETDTIAQIYNPISDREVGDPSYLDKLDGIESANSAIIGPYEKIHFDGRRLKSISVVLYNDRGKAEGFLCVNMDISVFTNFHNQIMQFTNTALGKKPGVAHRLFQNDSYEQINIFINEYCDARGLAFSNMSRGEKRSLIVALKANGAFSAKNAPAYIARILNISRASVYNYLRETKTPDARAG